MKLATEDSKPVGSVRLLSAQIPAGLMRGSRIRPRDPLFTSCLPEPRCQQALPVARGFDLFGSAREPPQGMIWPPGWLRPCLDILFPRQVGNAHLMENTLNHQKLGRATRLGKHTTFNAVLPHLT